MAKPKLTFVIPETFTSRVPIPVPGGKPVEVEFIFKGRDRVAYDEFLAELATHEDKPVSALMSAAVGWELEDEFTSENVGRLCATHLGAAREVLNVYIREMSGIAR